jgi:hypothetical protein
MEPLKCSKHPKYKGKKQPTNDCTECASIYFKLKKPRILPMPTKVIKDKSKYDRKDKHKK